MGKIEINFGGVGYIPSKKLIFHGVTDDFIDNIPTENFDMSDYVHYVYNKGIEYYETDTYVQLYGYYRQFKCVVIPIFDIVDGNADYRPYVYTVDRTTREYVNQSIGGYREQGGGYNRLHGFTDGFFDGQYVQSLDLDYYTQNQDGNPLQMDDINLYNIFVFESKAKLDEFVTKYYDEGITDKSLILNYGEDDKQQDFETSKQYYFSCSWNIFEKDETGLYSKRVNSGASKVVFESTDKRLYFTGVNDIDRNLVLKNYSGVPCDYSTVHGWRVWNSASTMPSDLEKVVNGKLKIDNNHIISGVLTTNIPIFSNNQKGQEYENENIEADQADNGDKLSKDDYSPVTKEITSGNAETETVLGSGVSMDKMTMFYKLNSSQLASFGATLFKTENLDSIVAGTKLVGQDALNSIIGLRFYPFDISSVCTTTGTYGIILGSWVSGVLSSGVITSNNGKINMGETMIEPVFNNFLDYTNVGLSVYLPYIGIRTIDIKNVLGKVLKVEYLVDITTGKCKAMLFANGLLFDSHEGVIARDCPISGTDAQSYNNANRNAQMNYNNAYISGRNILDTLTSSVKNSQFLMASGTIEAEYNTAELRMDDARQNVVNARNNLPVYGSGSSGGQLGELEPQYIYLIFTVNKTHLPQNERNLVGLPSNTSGTVSQFYGFLSCGVSKFETMASTTEKNMILQILANGIYI